MGIKKLISYLSYSLIIALLLFANQNLSFSEPVTSGEANTAVADAELFGISKEVMQFYVKDGKKLPLYILHVSSAMHLKIDIFLNGVKAAEAIPPRQIFSTGTINEYLKDGENSIEIKYEVVEVPADSKGYGPETFKIKLEKQLDWKDSNSASVIKEIRGPLNISDNVGSKGNIKEKFDIKFP